MGMSKYTRHKLRAHDRGEDRHNKGLSLIKKQTRLVREHQSAVELAAARRNKERKALAAQRQAEKEQEARIRANRLEQQRQKAKAKELASVTWHPTSLARELRKNQRIVPT